MRLAEIDLRDDAAYTAFHAVYARAHTERFDEPWGFAEKRTNLTSDAYAEHVVVAGEVDGEVVGGAWVSFPQQDNRTLAYLHVFVVPEERRRGYGSLLLREVERLAAERGRVNAFAEASWPVEETEGAGSAFALSHGYAVDLLDAIRALPLPAEVAPPVWRDGYTSVAWRRCPDEWLDQYAVLRALILAEAPSGEVGLEPEHFDAQRVRHEEARWAEQGRVGQTVAAVAPDGTLAGHTQLVVPDHGDTAYQWDTLVLPAHRGHGLGLAMKTAALDEAADLLSGRARVTTWNAASNTPMIAVNEALGYRQVAWAAELVKPLGS
ncbi:GNAT family N-acetyltransferase [Aeromicrobium erythreum]|uniref:GNAT family N-acetyltransferase n=1 Tax=Aeromicrobium erythreum TaxID=2041 RepID=UPI00083222EC|nr:GNAT family N-acetyltransferase [Aeromicrobium erythreum]